METATKPDALALVAGMATRGGAKKETKPAINDPALTEPIATYITRKREAETAQALADAAADQIFSAVRPRRLTLCQSAGKVLPSVSINGALTFTQTCRYSTIAEERKADLQAAFGDSFPRYFADTLAIGLNKASANDEAVLGKLLESLGPEFFAAHFDVRRDLVVLEPFHHDYSTRAEVTATAQQFMDDQTIRPYSPSLKIK